MARGIRGTVAKWLLLCLLVLGVVSMHHFIPSHGHEPAATMAEPEPMHDPAPMPSHELQHLCMAVLGAVAGLLLIGFLLTLPWPDPVALLRENRPSRRVERPPRFAGRALLNSVCVFRL